MKIKLDENAFMPIRAHETDAGLDLRSPIHALVKARGAVKIDTGVHIELPQNTAGFLKSKSGLMLRGITSEGVIDMGYTGSVMVMLFNHSDQDYYVQKGDKISQIVIIPILTPEIEVVDELDNTERGDGGFGSTGR